jgi:hypothetical protein
VGGMKNQMVVSWVIKDHGVKTSGWPPTTDHWYTLHMVVGTYEGDVQYVRFGDMVVAKDEEGAAQIWAKQYTDAIDCTKAIKEKEKEALGG